MGHIESSAFWPPIAAPRVTTKASATWVHSGYPIETQPMTPVGQAEDAAKHRCYGSQTRTPAIRNITSIWYFTASPGGTPPRICPVIMPGKENRPVADMELIVGINALRRAPPGSQATQHPIA